MLLLVLFFPSSVSRRFLVVVRDFYTAFFLLFCALVCVELYVWLYVRVFIYKQRSFFFTSPLFVNNISLLGAGAAASSTSSCFQSPFLPCAGRSVVPFSSSEPIPLSRCTYLRCHPIPKPAAAAAMAAQISGVRLMRAVLTKVLWTLKVGRNQQL